MDISSTIEAILFFRGEPVTLKKIAETLDISKDEVEASLKTLESKLADRGIKLMRESDEVMLVTAPEIGAVIEKITKEELSKDLGKAGLEVLSIVLYRGPVSRREIDHIRGVNSSFILRDLLIRGLIEKADERGEERGFVYKPTMELLSYLGVKKISELPEFESVRKEIEEFKSNEQKNGEPV